MGSECLDRTPIATEWPTQEERVSDEDVACCARRILICFGRVRFTDKAVWGDRKEEHIRLVTSDDRATYYIYSDDTYTTISVSMSLLSVQNPELRPFISWL